MRKFIDLTGQKFGKLTVINQAEDKISKKATISFVGIANAIAGKVILRITTIYYLVLLRNVKLADINKLQVLIDN